MHRILAGLAVVAVKGELKKVSISPQTWSEEVKIGLVLRLPSHFDHDLRLTAKIDQSFQVLPISVRQVVLKKYCCSASWRIYSLTVLDPRGASTAFHTKLSRNTRLQYSNT